jgi:hypothetical protein
MRLVRLTRGSLALLVMVLGAALCSAHPAEASWPSDPTVNLPVFTGGTVSPSPPVVAPDGVGGAVVVWEDARHAPGQDIYAQHILRSGEIDGSWPADGLPIATTEADELGPMASYDGRGGVIVGWFVDQTWVRAQRVLLSGQLDPNWPDGGLVVSTADAHPFGDPTEMVSDGAGGVIIAFEAWGAWQPGCCFKFLGLYLQRVLGSGQKDPGWPASGLRATAGIKGYLDLPGESLLGLIPDARGGAILAWADRVSASRSLAAQHVLASGEIDPAWPSTGLTVLDASLSPDPLWQVQMVPDGSGGAILVWPDDRNNPTTARDIYAQHILGSGALDHRWPVAGAALCTASNTQEFPMAVSDGRGGAFVVWLDRRNEDGRGDIGDIYAQHVRGSGDVSWTADGVPVCTAPQEQSAPAILSDDAGGTFAVWQDRRTAPALGDPAPFADLYAQRLLNSGAAQPTWPPNGQAITLAPSAQGPFAAVSDQRGGIVTVWMDTRSGKNDLYAQRVTRAGDLGEPSGNSRLSSTTAALVDESSQSPPLALILTPSPADGIATIGFSLAHPGAVGLAIYDASGRLVRILADGWREAGSHTFRWDLRDDRGAEVPRGLYFLRVVLGDREVVRKFVKL